MIQPGYLHTFAIGTAIMFAAYLAFISTVDPYGVSPLRFTFPGINTVKPKRLAIDRLIKPYEVWRYQPRTVFLGTSRFHQSIDPAVLDGTRFSPAYNAAIPAGGLAETAALLEEFFEFDKNLRVVFVELFLYHFLAAEPPRARRSLLQFLPQTAPLFLSGSAIYDSIQTVFFNVSGRPGAQVAAGGYWVPPSNYQRRFNQKHSIDFYVGVHKTNLQTMTLEPTAFAVLERIVELCRRNSAELVLVIPPTHPWDEYRLWSFGQWKVLEDWTRRLSVFENVFSFAQYNEAVAEPTVGDLKYWNDPLHFNTNLGQLILRSFLGDSDADIPSNLLREVTPATVESLLHERRAGMIRWVDESAAYTTAFDHAKAAFEKTQDRSR
jgi:hypothetical protein